MARRDLTAPAERITRRLAELGWEVLPEEDGPDFKDYACRHPEGLFDAFTVMSLVLMPGFLGDGREALDLRLTFWADPARVGSDKHAFQEQAEKGKHGVFREFCADLLRAAAIEPGKVWHREVRHLSEGKVTILFEGREPVAPAFEATIFQWGLFAER